jgi:uncharacterized membrane protein
LWRWALRVLLEHGITRRQVEDGEAGLEDAYLLAADSEKLAEQFEDALDRARAADDGETTRWLSELSHWD